MLHLILNGCKRHLFKIGTKLLIKTGNMAPQKLKYQCTSKAPLKMNYQCTSMVPKKMKYQCTSNIKGSPKNQILLYFKGSPKGEISVNIFRYFAHENKETKMVGLLTLPKDSLLSCTAGPRKPRQLECFQGDCCRPGFRT